MLKGLVLLAFAAPILTLVTAAETYVLVDGLAIGRNIDGDIWPLVFGATGSALVIGITFFGLVRTASRFYKWYLGSVLSVAFVTAIGGLFWGQRMAAERSDFEHSLALDFCAEFSATLPNCMDRAITCVRARRHLTEHRATRTLQGGDDSPIPPRHRALHACVADRT